MLFEIVTKEPNISDLLKSYLQVVEGETVVGVEVDLWLPELKEITNTF